MLTISDQSLGLGSILRFVSATNELQLERQMLKVQMRLKGAVRWHTPYVNPVNKKLYAWYTVNFDKDEQSRELQKVMDSRDE